MNEVIENIKSRRSVRNFKSEMIKKEELDSILEAGTYAPTGMNKQTPIIIAITNKEERDKLSKLNAKIMGNESIDPFYGAPVVVCVLAEKDERCHVYDGSLVIENMMLAANSLGIGSCWIHRAKEEFDSEEGKQILRKLNLDENKYEGIGHCILGYPETIPDCKPRKDGYIYKIN